MASEKQRRKRKSKALSALDEASMEEYEPRSHHKRRKSESGFLSGLKNTKVNEMEEYNGRKRQVNPLDLKKAKVNADTKGTPFDLGGAIQKNKNLDAFLLRAFPRLSLQLSYRIQHHRTLLSPLTSRFVLVFLIVLDITHNIFL